MAGLRTPSIAVGLLSVVLAYLYGTQVYRQLTIFGVFRTPSNTHAAANDTVVVIDGTKHCEDLHWHDPSQRLFTACEDSDTTRWSWWPPLANYDDPTALKDARGSLFVIDPKTQKAKRLQLENFSGPLVTHGIDVFSDLEVSQGHAVYIFAINHLPNPAVYGDYPYGPAKPGTEDLPRAASQIEIFQHVVGSSHARHLRSVKHELIRTPNDIQIIPGGGGGGEEDDDAGSKPLQFFVTNDHRYQHGRWRQIEDLYPGAKWTDTVHVKLDSLEAGGGDDDATSGVRASTALTGVWNNNGLGYAKTTGEVLLTSAMGATLYVGKAVEGEVNGAAGGLHHQRSININITDSIAFDSVVDNPSFFHDEAEGAGGGGSRSGVVLAGVGDVLSIPRHHKDDGRGRGEGGGEGEGVEAPKNPVRVWFAQPRYDPGPPPRRVWERTLLFEDDGARIRTASTAVLVSVGPALGDEEEEEEEEEGGQRRRRGWLYVTGFWAENMIAVKVDIPNPAGDPGRFGLARQEEH